MTPGEFAAHLAAMIAAEQAAKHEALEEAAQIIETKAKSFMGNYGAGTWPPLKPATIERKATGDSPLLETGELKGSIEHTVVGDHAYVGSNNQKAIWQFNGTSKIPPRDPLVPAAMQSEAEVTAKVGKIIYSALINS